MSIYGGKFKDIPLPWKLRTYPQGSQKRRIEISSISWGLNELGNGHHHVTIREENNSIWDEKENTWREPTCDKCLERQKSRPFLGELTEVKHD